jgi:ribose/xylose/arabinose/galactoside ABC-type transport system permease subunit
VGADRQLRASFQPYQRLAIVPILIVILILAQVEDPGFYYWGSVTEVLSQNASISIVAIGMTFVLIAGGVDISVGSLYAAGSCVYAKMALHDSLPVAFVLALLAGLVGGAFNGFIVTKLRFSPFVATLGTASVYGGIVLAYAGASAISPTNASFGTLGRGTLGSVPYLDLILVIMFLVGAAWLHRTAFGKSLFAIGGNLNATRLAGLRTGRLRASTYLISGACAAFGGVLAASQTGIGQATAGGGTTVALDAIAIVVLGGTSLLGGEGAMWRTGVGILILATVNSLFNVLAIDAATQALIEGAILLLALVIDAGIRANETR